MITLYDTLGILRTAKPEQIKRSYRGLVKRFHPDLFPAGSEAQHEAAERLSQANAAYAILSKPHKRANYDARLARFPARFQANVIAPIQKSGANEVLSRAARLPVRISFPVVFPD